jgi:transposase
VALGHRQKSGAIRICRSYLGSIDEARLEMASLECYRTTKTQYHACSLSQEKVCGEQAKRLYQERNRIERSFGRLMDFRRIATRFDRNVKNFMAALCLAAVVIWWC